MGLRPHMNGWWQGWWLIGSGAGQWELGWNMKDWAIPLFVGFDLMFEVKVGPVYVLRMQRILVG